VEEIMQMLDKNVGRIFTNLQGSPFKCSSIQKDMHLGENDALSYTAFTGKVVTLSVAQMALVFSI
jgi:hypothetical protein